ncbi:hypothetical protein ACFWDN_29315 [Micromonospora chalcea]
MLFRTSQEFERHSDNLAAIKRGLTQLERAHKQAIRRNDLAAVETLARMHVLAVGMLAECRLRQVLADPNGFNDRERMLVGRAKSQVNKWLDALEFAIRRHYSVLMHRAIDQHSIGRPEFLRFQEIQKLLNGDLRPVIEDRNKAAHGQWVWCLKSGKDNEFLSDPSPKILNYCEIESRRKLITIVGDLVHLLVVSRPGFDKHYDALVRRLDDARSGLPGSDYPQFVAQLRASRGRSRAGLKT